MYIPLSFILVFQFISIATLTSISLSKLWDWDVKWTADSGQFCRSVVLDKKLALFLQVEVLEPGSQYQGPRQLLIHSVNDLARRRKPRTPKLRNKTTTTSTTILAEMEMDILGIGSYKDPMFTFQSLFPPSRRHHHHNLLRNIHFGERN